MNERGGGGSPSLAVAARLALGPAHTLPGPHTPCCACCPRGPGRPHPGARWACGLLPLALPWGGIGVRGGLRVSSLAVRLFSEHHVGVLEAR